MRASAVFVLCVVTSCAGAISDEGEGPSQGGGRSPAMPGAAGGSGPGSLPEPSSACPRKPGQGNLRRLTVAEYREAVRDLFGQTSDVTTDFPPDPLTLRFDNNVETLNLTSAHASRYLAAAEKIAAELTSTHSRRQAVIGCDATGGDRTACLKSFVQRLGRRAFRRPITAVEQADLLGIVDAARADADPWMGASLVVQSVLQSPSFLFRTEVGTPDPKRPGWKRLDGFELATRLSFLLWGTTPPDDLLADAEAGRLDAADGVAAATDRLMKSPRAHQGLARFSAQWLATDRLGDVSRDPKQYPQWNDGLRQSMAEETRRFLDDALWRSGGRVTDLLTARRGFVDDALAAFYGVPAPKTPFAELGYAQGIPRVGFLTQGTFLTVTAASEVSAPIMRGKFIREALLCQALAPPPPDVPAVKDGEAGQTLRDRLEQHRKDPACAGCHTVLDPVGFGLEQYDAIGAFRDKDPSGEPLSGAGVLTGLPNPSFRGPLELGEKLAAAPDFAGCVVQHAMRFALGRREDDACAREAITDAFVRGQLAFPQLLFALVRSDAFRYVAP